MSLALASATAGASPGDLAGALPGRPSKTKSKNRFGRPCRDWFPVGWFLRRKCLRNSYLCRSMPSGVTPKRPLRVTSKPAIKKARFCALGGLYDGRARLLVWEENLLGSEGRSDSRRTAKIAIWWERPIYNPSVENKSVEFLWANVLRKLCSPWKEASVCSDCIVVPSLPGACTEPTCARHRLRCASRRLRPRRRWRRRQVCRARRQGEVDARRRTCQASPR